jgi:hypothetical protein
MLADIRQVEAAAHLLHDAFKTMETGRIKGMAASLDA